MFTSVYVGAFSLPRRQNALPQLGTPDPPSSALAFGICHKGHIRRDNCVSCYLLRAQINPINKQVPESDCLQEDKRLRGRQ